MHAVLRQAVGLWFSWRTLLETLSSGFPYGSHSEPKRKGQWATQGIIFFHACSHKVSDGQAETSEAFLALDLNSHTVTSVYFPLFKASHFSMPQINGQESKLFP